MKFCEVTIKTKAATQAVLWCGTVRYAVKLVLIEMKCFQMCEMSLAVRSCAIGTIYF